MVAGQGRVAIFGGDARQQDRWEEYGTAEFFQSPRHGGNGEVRRLAAAMRAGGIGLVVILARWNEHSGSGRIRKLAKKLGIGVILRP